jgi:hypothetical protein
MKKLLFARFGFALSYAALFGATSALAGWILSASMMAAGWEGFWLYSGSASFLVAWGLSYLLIQRRQACSTMRMVAVGTAIALVSHWFCWYLFLLLTYTRSLWGSPSDAMLANPWQAIPIAAGYALLSLAFLGWTSVPISIGICISMNRLSSTQTSQEKR